MVGAVQLMPYIITAGGKGFTSNVFLLYKSNTFWASVKRLEFICLVAPVSDMTSHIGLLLISLIFLAERIDFACK